MNISVIILWVCLGFVAAYGGLSLFNSNSTENGLNLGRAYISNMIAKLNPNQTEIQDTDDGALENGTVSRGKNQVRNTEEDVTASEIHTDGGVPWLLEGFLGSALPVGGEVVLGEAYYEEDEAGIVTSDKDLPEQIDAKEEAIPPADAAASEMIPTVQPAPDIVSSPTVKGAVLIYHTHSTESYEPYSEGNYHSIDERGTVREVGTKLEDALKTKGITVYHDKTLHDSPSYNSSYNRSLDTLKRQLNARPDIALIIDLHRDAAVSGKKYATVNVNGKSASSFNIVVGNKNDNYQKLLEFSNQFITTANNLYPGLGGRVIEREYKFNGYLSNHTLLLEVGNNMNTIEEVDATGTALADVIEAVMKTF